MAQRPAWLFPVMFCIGGLLMAHHPMLKDGLGWIQFDPGDTRFCNYLLEHGYRWMTRWPGHLDLWSPPFFFPSEGHLAWAENMLGTMPLYAVWRLAGFKLDTAFQLWVFTVGTLNYVAMYFFLRRAVKVEQFAACVGAVLFAFAGMRINQTMHYQLFPHFFSVWAVHACWVLAAEGPQLSERQRLRWLAVFFLAAAGQVAAGIYLGWFLLFVLCVALVVGLAFKEGRARLKFVFQAHALVIALFAAASAAALLPIARHYLGTSDQFGGRPFLEAMTMLPQPQAWFHLGNFSWVYGFTSEWKLFQSMPIEYELRLGYGLLTTALCVAGIWVTRREAGFKFLAVSLGVLILVVTVFGGFPDGVTLWKLVWSYFPGAKAIRGVGRIALVYLIAVAVFVAVALDRLRARGPKPATWAVFLGLGALFEQGETTVAFSKGQARQDIADIVEATGPDCAAFFFSPVDPTADAWKYQLDAMMAGLERGLPTLNGYSGQTPPGWELGEPGLRTHPDELRNARAAQAWISQQKIKEHVCWTKVAVQEGADRSTFLSVSVPKTVVAAQPLEVGMRLRNTGTTTWDPAKEYFVGSQAPRDNELWGRNRIPLPGVVRPGEEVELRVELTPPAAPGRYPFQWRMLQERVTWFGKLSPPIEVEVVPR